jgi:hypothetical protein
LNQLLRLSPSPASQALMLVRLREINPDFILKTAPIAVFRFIFY